MEFIDVSAKSVDEALQEAKEQLASRQQEMTSYEVVSHPKRGFLGFGRKPAIVRVFYKALVETSAEVDTHQEDVSLEAVPVEEGPQGPSHNRLQQEDAKQRGLEFLQALFLEMKLDVTIDVTTSAKSITYSIHGPDNMGALIGKHGQTLDAIQYLVEMVANQHYRTHFRILVDIEDYRQRRAETLRQLAKRLAHKARYNREPVRLEPMSAIERKVVHLALAKEKDIVTESKGQEPYRYVVISYKAQSL
ncbi:MAG: protein jag [Veillonella sp.]|mgnify:FL=1|nr:protein jag [Veillonella sp.]